MADETDVPVVEVRMVFLGDRMFRVIDFDRRTVVMDHYLMRLIRRCGADKAMPMDDETSAQFTIRLQAQIVDSGVAHEIVSGCVVPHDMKDERDWTPAQAKELAKFIGRLNSPEDRESVAILCVDVAFYFFKQGLEQYARSLGSSPKEHPTQESLNQEVQSLVH